MFISVGILEFTKVVWYGAKISRQIRTDSTLFECISKDTKDLDLQDETHMHASSLFIYPYSFSKNIPFPPRTCLFKVLADSSKLPFSRVSTPWSILLARKFDTLFLTYILVDFVAQLWCGKMSAISADSIREKCWGEKVSMISLITSANI